MPPYLAFPYSFWCSNSEPALDGLNRLLVSDEVLVEGSLLGALLTAADEILPFSGKVPKGRPESITDPDNTFPRGQPGSGCECLPTGSCLKCSTQAWWVLF